MLQSYKYNPGAIINGNKIINTNNAIAKGAASTPPTIIPGVETPPINNPIPNKHPARIPKNTTPAKKNTNNIK